MDKQKLKEQVETIRQAFGYINRFKKRDVRHQNRKLTHFASVFPDPYQRYRPAAPHRH